MYIYRCGGRKRKIITREFIICPHTCKVIEQAHIFVREKVKIVYKICVLAYLSKHGRYLLRRRFEDVDAITVQGLYSLFPIGRGIL